MPKKAEKQVQENIVNFSDVQIKSFDSEGQLTELVNQDVLIKAVEFVQIDFGGEDTTVAIATLVEGEEETKYHTFSIVLIKQLRALVPYLEQNKLVLAKILKKKNYYTLV